MSLTTDAQRQDFLAQTHVGVFAIERPGRIPLMAPIWYHYTPGGVIQIWTSKDAYKTKAITAAGEFAFLVQDEKPPYEWVRAEGPVTNIRPATPDDVRTIASRYLDEAGVATYVGYNDPEKNIIIEMQPTRFASLVE